MTLAVRKPPVAMESRDERVTVRLKPSERDVFQVAARAAGTEISRYIRECALMGHSVRQAQAVLKATGA